MRMRHRIMSLLLAAGLVAGLLPANVSQAAAAGNGTAIQLGVNGIASGDDLYYGTAPNEYTLTDENIKWRVLDTQTNTGSDEGLFVLSERALGDDVRLYEQPFYNTYQGSAAREWCQNFVSQKNYNFSSAEYNGILTTTKSDAAYVTASGVDYAATSNILSGDRLFLLSAEEADKAGYGFTSDGTRVATYDGQHNESWWLRSSKARTNYLMGQVSSEGAIGSERVDSTAAIRPAMNISRSNVLYSSLRSMDKTKALSAVGTAGSGANEWKLTLYSSYIKFSLNGTATQEGQTVTVPFQLDAPMNIQISVMITDKAYTDSGAQILYYGQALARAVYPGGTATFTLPDGVTDDDYIYVIAEYIDDDSSTGLASRPIRILGPDTEIHEVAVTGVTRPVAAQELGTTASCDTEHVASCSEVVWKDADRETVSGEADYYTVYTAYVTLTPEEGYTFASNMTATINGWKASVTVNGDGTATVSVPFAHTAKDRLTGITPVSALTVANGTDPSTIQLLVPRTVDVETAGGSISELEVTWNYNDLGSDYLFNEEAQTLTMSGTLTVPESLDMNGRSSTVTIQINVLEAGELAPPHVDEESQPGEYDSAVLVTFDKQDGESIFYTTDGSDPTVWSTMYRGPFTVTGKPGETVTVVVKAIRYKGPGYKPSDIATFTYEITLPEEEEPEDPDDPDHGQTEDPDAEDAAGVSGVTEKAWVCHHDYEWVTYKAATATTDGVMRYRCVKCGDVEYEVPTAAYYVFNKEAQEAIQNAEPGATVTVSTPIFISFHEMVADALLARLDVTLVVDYKNQGKSYEMVIPAGSGETLKALFGDSAYAGFLYLGGAFATVEK